jgi:hypothetical protein
MTLSYQSIYRRMRSGTIGPKGSYGFAPGSVSYTQDFQSYDIDNNPITVSDTKTLPVHQYRRQISAGMYEDLQVVGLQMQYQINEKYQTTGDEDDPILLVPIDRSITDEYSLPDREKLFARSLHFVFNSIVVVKVKWYQTGIFKALLLVVAVVITIYTGGAGSGMLAAIASGSTAALSAALMGLLIDLAIGAIISFGLKLFAKAVGGEFAIIIAVVAAVVAGGMMLNAGSVAGAPWAQELLSLASNLIQIGMQQGMQDIAAEFAAFSDYRDAALQELEDAQKLLGSTQNYLSPMVIFGESPTDFYNRTVHSGNIGVVGIGAISSYVENALRLPSLADSLGETAYG